MDIALSNEDLEFRDEAAQWLRERVPTDPRPFDAVDAAQFDKAWQRTQFDGGWAGISWPTEFGGRGLSLVRQMLWHEQYALAGAPHIGTCFVGVNHAGPTLIANADDLQKGFHLPRILSGEVIWCQGFSEPDAGSDLAGIRTRAEVDGDTLVVNGSKIWTSYAQVAQWQELLVRTDPESSRHAGLSWAICDMSTPGVEIRPIRLLNGSNDFCQVFYDDVRIPLENVVGGIGNGWQTAMSTLSFERGSAFMAEQVTFARNVERLIDLARETTGPGGGLPAIQNEETAGRLATMRATAAAIRAMTYASLSRTEKQGNPGPEGSMMRLYFSEAQQQLHALAMDILGVDAMRYDNSADGWSSAYLRSFASTVGGGTSDIQRNIIAQRVLGLPR